MGRLNRKLQKALTLIEILVVIFILEVLAAILYPVFSQARAKAKQTSCLSNLRQIGMAITMYEADDGEKFPYGIDPIDRYEPQMWSAYPDWQAQIPYMPLISQLLQSYTHSAAVFVCPSDAGMDYLDIAFPLKFPAHPSLAATYGSSYLYRTEISFRAMSETDFQLPAQVGVMCDAAGFWHGSGTALDSADVGDIRSIDNKQDSYRYNVLFGDFHAKSVDFYGLQRAWTVSLQ